MKLRFQFSLLTLALGVVALSIVAAIFMQPTARSAPALWVRYSEMRGGLVLQVMFDGGCVDFFEDRPPYGSADEARLANLAVFIRRGDSQLPADVEKRYAAIYKIAVEHLHVAELESAEYQNRSILLNADLEPLRGTRLKPLKIGEADVPPSVPQGVRGVIHPRSP